MRRYLIFAVLIVAIVILLSSLAFIPLCQSENLDLDFSVEPAKGIEPLLVEVRISAHSTKKIRLIQLDLDGDGKYDLDERPNSRNYEKTVTETYYFPDFPVVDDFKYSGFPITIYVRVEGEEKVKEDSQTILVLQRKEFDFYLVASTCSGSPPLSVGFSLYIKDCSDCSFRWDCDGDGIFEFSTKATYNLCQFADPGLYPSTVSIEDKLGNYAVSKYFFCEKIASSKISRYIEVISGNEVFSAPFFSQTMKIGDVFTYGSTEYVALLGRPGVMIIKNSKEVVDWFGLDLLSDFSSPTFAKFYFNGGKAYLYFSSSAGTFKWAEDIRYTEKISDRNFLFLYPVEVSGSSSPLTYTIIIDHINQILLICDRDWNNCWEIKHPQIGFYSSVKSFYDAENFHLLLVNRGTDPPVYIELIKIPLYGQFPGVQTEFVITTEDFPELYSVYEFDYIDGRLVILPSLLSDSFYIVDVSNRNLLKFERDNWKLAFLSISLIDIDKIFLGTNEFPCEVHGELSPCNSVVFSVNQRKFSSVKGRGETLFSYSNGGKIYSVTSKSLETFYQDRRDTFRLLRSLKDFFFDGERIYIAGDGGYAVFTKELTFIKYFEVPEGSPSAIYPKDNFIFVGISDDIETSQVQEGKVIISYDYEGEWKSVAINDERLLSAQINCVSALKDGSSLLLFVCAGNKLLVFSVSPDAQNIIIKNGKEITTDQPIIGVFPTSRRVYAISSGKLYVFAPDGTKVSEHETIMQFYQIDVDEQRNLLFSAEGQDHTFRIWDISGDFPVEITRISLDYGVPNDIAAGVSHLGNHLFIASSYSGLMEFDIKNPSKPYIIKKTHFDKVYFSLGKCYSSYEFSACLGSPGIIFFIK